MTSSIYHSLTLSLPLFLLLLYPYSSQESVTLLRSKSFPHSLFSSLHAFLPVPLFLHLYPLFCFSPIFSITLPYHLSLCFLLHHLPLSIVPPPVRENPPFVVESTSLSDRLSYWSHTLSIAAHTPTPWLFPTKIKPPYYFPAWFPGD